jgi:signal transduction histidine kinase
MENYARLLGDKTSQQLQDLIAELRAKNFALTTELRQAKELAEQANLIKTEFMRNMEHDIRTPFNGVLALTNCLRDIEEDVAKKEHLNNIAESAQELLDYCNSILDFSKIDLGMLAVVQKKFAFKNLIDSIIKMELPAARCKNLALKLNCAFNIPPILIGDHYRLKRILINLISNAIKFTSIGFVELNISVLRQSTKAVLLRFIIADTGTGIAEESQEYIFEKFSRLILSNKGTYKGIGLGLRIVKQFMLEMGGEIDLLSTLGEGTKFICTIPLDLPLTDDFVTE